MSARHRIGTKVSRSLRWALAESLLSAGFSFATIIVVARYLNPAEFGLAGLALAISMIVQTLCLGGMPDALNRTASAHTRLTDAFFWRVLALGILSSVLSAIAGYAFAILYSLPALAPLTLAQSSTCFLFALSALPTGLLMRKMRTATLASRTASGKAVGLAVSCALAISDFGAWSLIVGQIANQLVCCVHMWLMMSRLPKLRLSDSDLPLLMHIGFMAGAQHSLIGLTTRGFILLYAAAFGPYAVGIFNFALRFVEESGMIIMNTLRRVGVAMFASAKRSQLDIRDIFLRGTKMVTYIAAPLFLGTAAIMPDILPLFFGIKWLPAVPISQLLLVMWTVRATRLLAPPLLLAEGKSKTLVMTALFGMALTLLIFLLVNPFGAQWTAYSYAATLLGTVPAGIVALKKLCRISVREQLSACFKPIAIALVMVLFVTWLRLGVLSSWTAEVRLFLCIGAGASVFLCLAMIFDRSVLRQIVTTIKR
jgi:O-antigen/teichoic acid export membrane protein